MNTIFKEHHEKCGKWNANIGTFPWLKFCWSSNFSDLKYTWENSLSKKPLCNQNTKVPTLLEVCILLTRMKIYQIVGLPALSKRKCIEWVRSGCLQIGTMRTRTTKTAITQNFMILKENSFQIFRVEKTHFYISLF